MRTSFVSAAFLALVSSVFAQTPGFDAISAPAQDQTLAVGSTFDIKWAPNSVKGPVTIILLQGSTPSTLQLGQTVASSIDNLSGKFAWTIPASVGKFATYGFKIQLDSDPNTFQFSFPFHITAAAASSSTTTSTKVATSGHASSSTSTSTSASAPTSVSATLSAPASTKTVILSHGTGYTSTSTPCFTASRNSTVTTAIYTPVTTYPASNVTLSTTLVMTKTPVGFPASSGSAPTTTASGASPYETTNAGVMNVARGGFAVLGGMAIALFLYLESFRLANITMDIQLVLEDVVHWLGRSCYWLFSCPGSEKAVDWNCTLSSSSNRTVVSFPQETFSNFPTPLQDTQLNHIPAVLAVLDRKRLRHRRKPFTSYNSPILELPKASLVLSILLHKTTSTGVSRGMAGSSEAWRPSGTGPSDRGETSLDAAMRAPSTTTPDVVVLDFVEEEKKPKEVIDPTKDLWLSSVDGRHQSRIIPVRVGPHCETFLVHRDILTKSEYFRKALDGEFREAEDQAVDLPEENPAIFSFVVAFLYEEKFVPIKPIATALIAEPDKGKGKAITDDVALDGSDDGSDSGSASDERQWYNGIPPPPQPVILNRHGYPARARDRDRRRNSRNLLVSEDPVIEDRMSVEDLQAWCMAYSLSIDVYVCADRYLMQDFKSCISSWVINNFEIAGLDAAQPAVLASCKTLHRGVSSTDPLLKKVFARVGFLQARLWKRFPEETSAFFMENPELATLIMKEMIERREEDIQDDLPAMERPMPPPPIREDIFIQGPRRRYDAPLPY
ncbi:hypothetical protein B7463_g6659, partial [Scytalidium lignicola]